jgi:S-DNA-T family DNA segregation ATPase FtsK/SpoIIIE
VLGNDKEKAMDIITWVEREVERRNKIFDKYDVNDYKEFKIKCKKSDMKEIVVIGDEIHYLRDEKSKDSPMHTLETLAMIARSTGIHLILCTQRPSANIITGDLKANLSSCIGLKVINELNSRIIIDHGGLEQLRGDGHGILKVKGIETEMQSIYITHDEAKRMVEPYLIDKEKEKKNNNFEPKEAIVEKEKKFNGKVEEYINIDDILGVDDNDE